MSSLTGRPRSSAAALTGWLGVSPSPSTLVRAGHDERDVEAGVDQGAEGDRHLCLQECQPPERGGGLVTAAGVGHLADARRG